MASKSGTSRTLNRKARTSQPAAEPNTPYDDCGDVAKKLKKALKTAQSGEAIGALVITIDAEGEWGATLAGQLERDSDTLCAIACRLLGGCLAMP